MLLPQSVCLLNSGMCIGEVQPMNLGLGKSEKGRYALHDDDPMQGRLAFFDVYRMHWCKERDICSEVAGATRLRRRWARVMDQAHFYPHPVMDGTNVWTAFAYVSGENVLLVAFNRGKRRASLRALGTLPPLGTLQNGEWHIAYYNGTFNLPCDAARLPMLAPGELIVLERRAPHTSNRRDEA